MTLIKSTSGLRGTIGGNAGENLTPIDVVKFAAGYGAWIREHHKSAKKVVIGRDARPSGETFARLVTDTLINLGINVVDLGLSTTPTVAMAVTAEKAQGGIILTASHNPAGWNALKFLNENGEFISQEEGNSVLALAEGSVEFVPVQKFGSYKTNDSYIQYHIDQILKHDLVDTKAIKNANFKVVLDAVNSTGGISILPLLQQLGVEVKALFCEPNGSFPHNPEPLPENLQQISSELKNGQYDLGIVVDPDVDRLALVMEDGEVFGEEYTLVAVADYVLSRRKGNTVSNLSSTRALRDITEKYGCEYNSSAVGEIHVVAKMKETNAVIGGEGNGGVIVPELHYGRDALAAVALFLSHLARFGKSVSILRATYPNYFISKNKIELTPDIDVDGVLESIKEKYKANPINTIDGVKVEFDNEWMQLRKSNTEPIIRIFTESQSQNTAEHLAQKLLMDIKEIISK